MTIRSALIVALLLTFAIPVGAETETLIEAHSRWNAALSAGDAEAIEGFLADDGWIVFGLEKQRTQLPLPEWFPHFRSALDTGTAFSVQDTDVRSGGGEKAGWVFAVQELSWTPEGMSEPAVVRSWYTTEAWELRDGKWKVVHIHHSLAPEAEEPADE